MKVLIVSEGQHERGTDPQADLEQRNSALEQIVQRLATMDIECDHDRVQNPMLHTHRGKGQGFTKRAVRWMRHAQKQGYDALILLIDEDGHSNRIREIDEAQVHELGIGRRALGVALTSVLDQQISKQKTPENMREPKSVCRSLLESAGNSMAQREMYFALAKDADLDVLEKRCPKGFAPFAERVKQL